MKRIIAIGLLSILVLIAGCNKEDIKSNNLNQQNLSSEKSYSLKTIDAKESYEKKVEIVIEKLFEKLEKRVKEKKFKDGDIILMAAAPEPIPQDTLIEEITDEDVLQLVDDLSDASTNLLNSMGISTSGYDDGNLVLNAQLADIFDDANDDGFGFGLTGPSEITYFYPSSAGSDDPFITVLNDCCHDAIVSAGFVWGGAISAGASTAFFTKQSIKQVIISLIGATAAEALAPITIGWMVWNVIWCVGQHYYTQT